MTPDPGASAFEVLRDLTERFSLAAAGDEKHAEYLEALVDAYENDLRRALRVAKAKAANARDLEERLDEALRLVEVERRAWEETSPRGGRKKAQIQEETRRKVRRLLRANPKIGWPTIRVATGLSEWLAKRVLAEERARAQEETQQLAGGNPSPGRRPR
jgi:phosphoenolpyruvate synthase/pyruvate phosphate dikinase